MNWSERHEADIKFADDTLLRTGELTRMIVIHGEERTSCVLAGWSNDAERESVYAQVGLLAAAEGAAALSFMSEGWLRTARKHHNETDAEHEARVNAVRPSQAEDRVECVTVATCYLDDAGDKQTLFTALEILRDDTGKVSGTKRLDAGDGVKARIADCLPSAVFSPEHRAVAREMMNEVGSVTGYRMKEVEYQVGHA